MRKGFTLVELSIVLVIIGLLIGGVLKGKSLIENAKIKNLVTQYNSLTAAIYSYQDKFNALPGDDPLATTNLASSGCTVANGNGDGLIGEYYPAIQHLACGEFITGSYNGTSQTAKSTYGGNVFIFNQTTQGKAGNLVRFDNLPAEVAKAFDAKIDDGIYNTGSVRASADYTAGTVIGQTGAYY